MHKKVEVHSPIRTHYVQSMLLNISQDDMKHGATLTSNICLHTIKVRWIGNLKTPYHYQYDA